MTTDGDGEITARPAGAAGSGRSPLRGPEVQALLLGLAEAAAALAADERAVDAEVARCEAAEEALIVAGSEAESVARVLASARWRVAVASAKETRVVRREVVSWWADVAVYVLLVTSRGWPPDAARVGATEPGRFYGPEDLVRLPPVDPDRKKLAEMALRMWRGSTDPDDVDLAGLARDAAERSGLSVRTGPDGSIELVEDGSVESRRCRLWGDVWADHQIPDLPEEDWLVDLLTRLHSPAEVVEAAGSVSREYERLRRAAYRCTEITAVEDWDMVADVASEYDAMSDVLDTASDVLDTYARTLTAVLPILWAHRSG